MLRATLLLSVLVALWAIAIAFGFERTQGPDRLDPERHHTLIRGVELVLYGDEKPALDDGDRAANAVLRLAEAIAPADAPFRDRQRALRLYDVIGLASATGDAGYALPDLAPVRREWERQRDALFEPAPWFKRSDDTRVATQSPRRATADPAEVTRLRHTVRRLERLADAGEVEVRELGEPSYSIAALDLTGRLQIERWNVWARRWEMRLDDALRDFPPRPSTDADVALVAAHRNTSRAAQELRLVPRGAGEWPTPLRSQWESRFNTARRLLAEQREPLVSTPR